MNRRLGRKSLQPLGCHASTLIDVFGDLQARELTWTILEETGADWITDGSKAVTVNRRFSALKLAFDLGSRIDPRVPAPLKTPHWKESAPRSGFLEPATFAALVAELPADLRPFVRWLGTTGMRIGEAAQLEWCDLDGDTLRVRGGTAKNGINRTLPVVGPLVAIMADASEARRLDCPLVFHVDGESIDRVLRKAWGPATKRAGLGSWLIHDLRRSAVRNLVRSGVSETVAMTISGHQDRAVFCRFNVSSDDDKSAALTRVGAYLEKADTTPNVQVHPASKTAGRSMIRTEIVRMLGAESPAPVTQPVDPSMIPSSPATEMGLTQ